MHALLIEGGSRWGLAAVEWSGSRRVRRGSIHALRASDHGPCMSLEGGDDGGGSLRQRDEPSCRRAATPRAVERGQHCEARDESTDRTCDDEHQRPHMRGGRR